VPVISGRPFTEIVRSVFFERCMSFAATKHVRFATQAAYARLPLPWPSSHSVQHAPTPLKHLTLAGLPHLQVTGRKLFAALAAGMSWFLASKTG